MDINRADICRLCLKKCNDFSLIEEGHRDTLNLLLLFVDLAISDGPVICKTCAENMQKCLTFKTTSLYIKDTAMQIVDMCLFCKISTNASGRSFMFLNSEDLDIMLFKAMLEQYFPELDLNANRNPAVCSTCYANLQKNFDFIINCLSMEQNIKKYCETIGTGIKCQVDLENVQCFLSCFITENTVDSKENCNIIAVMKIDNASSIKQEQDSDKYTEVDDRIKTEVPDEELIPAIVKTEAIWEEEDSDNIMDTKVNFEEIDMKMLHQEFKIEDEISNVTDTISECIEEVVRRYSKCGEESDWGIQREKYVRKNGNKVDVVKTHEHKETEDSSKTAERGMRKKWWTNVYICSGDRDRKDVPFIQRTLRDHSNPFEIPDRNFLKLFRLSKVAVEYLITIISPHLPVSQRITCIPKHIKILAALNFLGLGSCQFLVGQNHLFALSQTAVSKCLWSVVNVINMHFLNVWIKFPITAEQKDRVKDGFLRKFNFPGIIGAVDCTHIAIVCPPQEHPTYPGKIYCNRKRYTSVNTQVICDSNLQVLSINAQSPGSTHDAAIWATSTVKFHLQRNFLKGDESSYLLGDSGYPLQPWLLTPIVGAAEGTPEAAYTRRHIQARNCIERFKGVFKARFRCCSRPRVLNYTPPKAAKIIYACAVLHNLSIHYRNDEPDQPEEIEEDEENESHDNIHNNWLDDGQRIRNNVIANNFMI